MNLDDQPETLTTNSLELSVGQRFELERMNRAIESCNSVEELRSLTKSLVSAWMTQKAAIAWMIRQQIEDRRPPSWPKQ